jgi:hypothetical protein
MASGLTVVPLELDTPWEAVVTLEGHVLYTEMYRGLSVYTAGNIQRVPRHIARYNFCSARVLVGVVTCLGTCYLVCLFPIL